MLDASLSRSCARAVTPEGLRKGDEPFKRCEGTDVRGMGPRGGEIWFGFSLAMLSFYLLTTVVLRIAEVLLTGITGCVFT